MKKFLFLSLLAMGLIAVTGFQSATNAEAAGFKISKKANTVIQAKCYGCHSAEGKSDKAKAKLMWDDLSGLSAEEQLEKMKNIQMVLQEGKMPPKGFVERMPDKNITEAEKAIMQKWADKSVAKLSK
ncbi:MAG: heme-binding domain-containing protein [Bacteroidia bacterium]